MPNIKKGYNCTIKQKRKVFDLAFLYDNVN